MRDRAQARRRRVAALSAMGVLVAVIVLLATSAGRGAHAPNDVHAASRSARVSARRRRIRATKGLMARENAAIDRLLTRQPFITAGGRERREIALTFDDGPGPYTPAMLNELHRLGVSATFFEIGFMIPYFHYSVRRELHMHMVIGDHTETHPMMARLGPAAQRHQIVVQPRQLARYGAPFPRLFRPPYGSFDRATFAILRRLRMLMVLWTVDTGDYSQPGVAAIVQRALAGARPGAIILMHDAGGTRTETIEALPRIVRALRRRGYRLVTIPRLVLDDPPRGTQPLPTSLAGG